MTPEEQKFWKRIKWPKKRKCNALNPKSCGSLSWKCSQCYENALIEECKEAVNIALTERRKRGK